LGAVFVSGLVALIAVDHRITPQGALLFPLAVLIAVPVGGEMLRLTSVHGHRPVAWVVYLGTLLVVAASGVPYLWPDYPQRCALGTLGWPLCAVTLALLLAVTAEQVRYRPSSGAAVNLALAVFCVAYAGLLLAFIVEVRFVGGAAWNTVPLISLLVVVKSSDTGAYAVGRLIGRHKLAPHLSPGKTIEGLLGGLACGVGGSWLVFAVIAPRIADIPEGSVTATGIVLYGVLLGVAGVCGDLTISLMKRDSGYKDSSAWLPGYGGVLDMLDSVLVAAPVAYALWIAGTFGPLALAGNG
jgi:phosphatidate cytidylyltransferase